MPCMAICISIYCHYRPHILASLYVAQLWMRVIILQAFMPYHETVQDARLIDV